MFDSAVQLTFPCPACGSFLTLRQFRATGPCPNCGTVLEVSLDVHQLAAEGADFIASGGGKRFEERRFRPVVRLPVEPPPVTVPEGPPPAPHPENP